MESVGLLSLRGQDVWDFKIYITYGMFCICHAKQLGKMGNHTYEYQVAQMRRKPLGLSNMPGLGGPDLASGPYV